MQQHNDDATLRLAHRIGAAAAETAGSDFPGAEQFVRLLLSSTDETSLADLPEAVLTAHAVSASRFLLDRRPGTHRIATRTDEAELDGKTVRYTVVEILNDDMPFLLDSVLGEVQARAAGIRLVLHPLFKVTRGADGRLDAVTGPGDRNWGDRKQESYISIHLNELPAAAVEDLVDALSVTLDQVRTAVADWKPMVSRLDRAIAELKQTPTGDATELRDESIAFLEWLRDNNFTFLGARDYTLIGEGETVELVDVVGGGLGLLGDPTVQVLRRGTELVAMTPEIRRFFFAPSPLIITKANVVSRVHRRVHMDYIGIKRYGPQGMPVGEVRFVGLFTSTAYTQSPLAIPLLRRKVGGIIASHGAPPESHAGKALINVLATFPRDELFQISATDLERWSAAILDLEIRPRLRVFARPDRFDRFVSVLVYVPRDRYNSAIRERIGAFLADRFQGNVSAFYPSFGEGALARVHFIIGRRTGMTPVVSEAELEHGVRAITRTWEDQLAEAIAAAPGNREVIAQRYGRAFSAGYAETFSIERALEDIGRIERLGPDRSTAVDFYSRPDDEPTQVRAAIYRLDGPVSLSERVPVLENLGFTVIEERTYRLRPELASGRRDVVLHDMLLETADGVPFAGDQTSSLGSRIEETFIAVTQGRAENDGFNRLVMAAGANWREVAVVRYYAAYLRQLGSAFGIRYVTDTLARHAGIVRDIIELFGARFDPSRAMSLDQRSARQLVIRGQIDAALAKVESLDEDRILRQLTALVSATVRTNAFQTTAAGELPDTVAFKLNGRDLDMAPQPRSYREMWVASPRVEAVHLRFAPIARGGIRWSDRPLDFRTEVLGLAKAQQVKNAVIVPAGAKGGFFPKRLPRTGSREEIQKEGTEAYKIFVATMLDITDDIREGAIVPPANVIRYDGDDPYLVVAADKGTATFSDTANGISTSRGYWLADAFASGGSAGYDHKGIAITSRGAWECVKRHFREIDVDIQAAPFRAVGVGDMSGDVFGNGMLRSDATKLVAAFDHRDIFLDPDPDPARSFAERQRMFKVPRSSWADYDRAAISAGGGVFSRNAKSIPVSLQVRALLGLDKDQATPAEMMRAILKAEVDLLFFGGIGTYVRATAETDAEVGDRNNDSLRITGAEIRARVVGEGANLGMTQRGRIEAAARGVRLNTDFIDNSAGVNCSDQEVNIKIALGPVVRSGRLAIEARNALLKAMTDDVAQAVLRNNYQQSLAISLAERRAAGELWASARLIRTLEGRGLLDRALEALPSDREIAERQRAGRGLVRPELAILSSYAKIALLHDLLAGTVPDDPALASFLIEYFPPALQQAYGGDLATHRLRREIIATTLTNGLVNRLGAPTAYLLAEETSRTVDDVARAFIAVRGVYSLAGLWRQIDALDGKAPGGVQLDLYDRVKDFAVTQTRTFLRQGILGEEKSDAIRGIVRALPAIDQQNAAEIGELQRQGVPAAIAAEFARLGQLARAPLVDAIGRETGASASQCLGIVSELMRYIDPAALSQRVSGLRAVDDYDRRAMQQGLESLGEALSILARKAAAAAQSGTPLERWLDAKKPLLERIRTDVAGLVAAEPLTPSRVVVTAGAINMQASVGE